MSCRVPGPHEQRGLVLITSLVILVVLTILALAAVQNSTLEERMAGNLRAESVAFQAGEAALRHAESWLDDQVGKPVAQAVAAGSAGDPVVRPWEHPETEHDNTATLWWEEFTADDWEAWADVLPDGAAESLLVLPATSLADEQLAPRYLVEEMPAVSESLVIGQQQDYSGPSFYQVTARGVAVGGRSEVLLRSTFSRRF